MIKSLQEYQKKKQFLVCVDSDGCAMDTMDIKHFRCFGPCMVSEWGLQAWEDAILARWNEINLYTMTRGINRFKGLAFALTEINEAYTEIEGLPALQKWAEEADELSNDSLKHAIAQENPICLQKALAWSIAVNENITHLPDEAKQPFGGVKAALAHAHEVADIAIVSSANPDAVYEEWEGHGLLAHTDIVLAQNAGSKAFCIGELLKKGYDPEAVVMCGDAPGDLQAAQKNGVFFYPILVRKEQESWEEFLGLALGNLTDGRYGGSYQQSKIQAFLNNLGG